MDRYFVRKRLCVLAIKKREIVNLQLQQMIMEENNMKIYESVSMKNIRFCMTYAPDYGYTSFEEILVEAPEHVLRLIKDKYYQCTSLALQFIKEIADIPIKSLRQEYYDDNSFDYYLNDLSES